MGALGLVDAIAFGADRVAARAREVARWTARRERVDGMCAHARVALWTGFGVER